MQVVRFAPAVVLIAPMIALPMAAPAGRASDAFQVAQASSAQRQAQTAPAPGGSDQQAEGQIADLRRLLKITPAQQPPFDALAQVMRQNAEAMNKLVAQQPHGAKPNAVEVLRAAQQFAQAEADRLGRILPALEALYSTLSDEQKHAADRVFVGAPEQEQERPPARKRR